MKKIIAGLAAGVVLLAPLPAHAAAPDPIKVLQAQVVPGRGSPSPWSLVCWPTASSSAPPDSTSRRFPQGVAGGDDESTTLYSPLLKEDLEGDDLFPLFPTLLIRVKGANYTSGGELVGRLPPGKKWVRSRWPESNPSDLTVDLFQPGTLQALLATASSIGPRAARGTIYTAKIPGLPFGGLRERGEKVAWGALVRRQGQGHPPDHQDLSADE